MSATPQHWIGTDAGTARPGNEDAFLWLGPDETGDNGQLWLVVDGEGGEGVGNLAAAMVVVTVGELYGELLDLHRDPVVALEVALREVDRRLETVAKVYPRLVGVRASYAAAALFEERIYPVVAGTAAVFVIRNGEVQRIGANDVKKHHRDATDSDPVPGSGVGIYGPLRQHVGEPLDPHLVNLFLCTDGITETVPDGLIGQAVERLSPKDAVEGLTELARRRWGDDDATAALVRFLDPNLQAHTTVDAFLDWAESGMTKWPDRTLMLKLGSATTHEVPPRTNVESLPPIVGEEVAPGADEQVIERTLSFSAAQVREIVQASGGAPGGQLEASYEQADDAGARQVEANSGQERNADAAPPETTPGQVPGAAVPRAAEITPGKVPGAAEMTSGQVPSAPPGITPGQVPPAPPAPLQGPVTSAGGTFIFSPQQMAQVRAAAEAADLDAARPSGSQRGDVPAPTTVPSATPHPTTVPSATPHPTTVPSATPHPTTEPIDGGPAVTADSAAHSGTGADAAHVGAESGGGGGDIGRTGDLGGQTEIQVPRTAEFRGVTGRAARDTAADDTETVQREQLTAAELRARPSVLVPVLLLIVAAAAVTLGVWFALR